MLRIPGKCNIWRLLIYFFLNTSGAWKGVAFAWLSGWWEWQHSKLYKQKKREKEKKIIRVSEKAMLESWRQERKKVISRIAKSVDRQIDTKLNLFFHWQKSHSSNSWPRQTDWHSEYIRTDRQTFQFFICPDLSGRVAWLKNGSHLRVWWQKKAGNSNCTSFGSAEGLVEIALCQLKGLNDKIGQRVVNVLITYVLFPLVKVLFRRCRRQ